MSKRSVFANPVQRNIHVGKRSSIEATFNHGNLHELGRCVPPFLDRSGKSPLLFQPL
jgi:hypothetical protein